VLDALQGPRVSNQGAERATTRHVSR
jgi:hypothetical protein